MRKVCVLVLALISIEVQALEQRQLLVPSKAAEFLRQFDNALLLAKDGDAAVVQVDDNQIDAWSEFVHKRFGKCGGFFDVTADMDMGKSPRHLLDVYQVNTMLIPFTAPVEVVHSERVASLVGSIKSDHIRSFLLELTAFNDRSATTTNGTKAADFIAQRANDLGKNLAGFSVRKVATRTYPNQPSVVATLPGSKPTLPHIVIGGHMDTLSNNKPGADDDGSGSATVMEALRSIAASDAKFERTIDFVWYAAEERGLVGSQNVVRDFKENKIAVGAAIQFDMTGWVNPDGLREIYLTDDYTDAGLTQTLENIIKTYLPTVSIGHAECGYACSDHATWNASGVPSTFPFESHHDDYNRYIHTSSDKIDYLTLSHMTKFAQIAVAFLGQMATLQ